MSFSVPGGAFFGGIGPGGRGPRRRNMRTSSFNDSKAPEASQANGRAVEGAEYMSTRFSTSADSPPKMNNGASDAVQSNRAGAAAAAAQGAAARAAAQGAASMKEWNARLLESAKNWKEGGKHVETLWQSQWKRLEELRSQPLPRLELPPIPIEFDMVTPQVRHAAQFARASWQSLPPQARELAPAVLGIFGVIGTANALGNAARKNREAAVPDGTAILSSAVAGAPKNAMDDPQYLREQLLRVIDEKRSLERRLLEAELSLAAARGATLDGSVDMAAAAARALAQQAEAAVAAAVSAAAAANASARRAEMAAGMGALAAAKA